MGRGASHCQPWLGSAKGKSVALGGPHTAKRAMPCQWPFLHQPLRCTSVAHRWRLLDNAGDGSCGGGGQGAEGAVAAVEAVGAAVARRGRTVALSFRPLETRTPCLPHASSAAGWPLLWGRPLHARSSSPREAALNLHCAQGGCRHPCAVPRRRDSTVRCRGGVRASITALTRPILLPPPPPSTPLGMFSALHTRQASLLVSMPATLSTRSLRCLPFPPQ